MQDRFFDQPILNSPYEYPTQHWELDDEGQPTYKILLLGPEVADVDGNTEVRSGLAYAVLDEKMQSAEGKISVSTMHLAKGLEFRAVAVMACDDEVVPLQERIETVNDDADLEDVYNTERHLLYVACTRARDHLLVSGVEPASEFLDDLQLQ